MFDMYSFEKELDEQNAALEAMLDELDFDSSDSLLDKVQRQVDSKCDTVEACESMLFKLSNEISEYNDALHTMKVAAESFKEDGDKDALGDAIRPASDMIRQKYEMITLESVSTDGLVTDTEIRTVHDFLAGSMNIIQDKMDSLRYAGESFIESCSNSVDIATEGLKETLVKAKDAFIRWIQKIIDKFKRKEKTEKDPKKKNIISKFLSKLKAFFSKGKNAKTVEEIQEVKSNVEENLEETEKLYDSVFDSQYDDANESKLIEISHQELELALESCVIAQEAYYDSLIDGNDVDIATESADAVAVGAVLGMYGALIAMAVKAGMTDEAKYVRRLQKELKPKEKEYKKAIKVAKKARSFDEAIAYTNKLIALYENILKEIDSLGRDVEISRRKDASGKDTSTEYYKSFNTNVAVTKEKYKEAIHNLKLSIKMLQADKAKKAKVAKESDVEAAYIEGYTRALEAMSKENDDIDSFLENFAL